MRNYTLVDVLKFVFAIIVVGIHTKLLNLDNFIESTIYHTLFEISVPFYFVTTGILSGMQMYNKPIDELLIKRIKSFFKIYLIWGGVYFVIRIIKNCVLTHNINNIYGMIHELVVTTPGGAMWYIYACLWFFICLQIILTNNSNTKRVLKILTIFYFVFNILLVVLVQTDSFKNTLIFKAYNTIFINNCNFIANGIFIILGIWIGMYFDSIIKTIRKSYLIFIALILELLVYVVFRAYIYNSDFWMTVFIFQIIKIAVVCSIAMIAFSIDKLSIDTITIRKMSIIIYLAHPIPINLWDMMIPKVSERLAENGRLEFIFVLILTLVIAYTIVKFKNGKLYKLLIG